MLTAIVLIAIVLIALWGYHNLTLQNLRADLAAESKVASEYYELCVQWEVYAESLASENTALRNEIIRIAPYAMDSLISQGKVKATKLTYNAGINGNGKAKQESIYALDMFGLAPKDGFEPSFDPDGTIVYKPVVKVETPSNGSKDTKPENKPSDNAAKSSNGDLGTFEATNTLDDKALLTGDKFGELLDTLTAHLKLKKGSRLPSAKYEYVKTMFLTWERGKKPNTAKEYASRIINNKFGGK